MQNQPKENYIASKFGITGRVEIKLWGPDGKLKDHRVIKEHRMFPNTVTTFGDRLVANRLSGATLTAPSHMAVGTGTGATSAYNSLVTQLDRNALTSTTQGTGSTSNQAKITYIGDWAAGDGTGAITEAGIFNHASNPGMYVYSSFSVVNKGASDTLQISWVVTFA